MSCPDVPQGQEHRGLGREVGWGQKGFHRAEPVEGWARVQVVSPAPGGNRQAALALGLSLGLHRGPGHQLVPKLSGCPRRLVGMSPSSSPLG